MNWVREPIHSTSGLEYTTDGFVLLFDSTGYYQGFCDVLRRNIGSDTVHIGGENWQVWTGSWNRHGSMIQVRAVKTYDYAGPGKVEGQLAVREGGR